MHSTATEVSHPKAPPRGEVTHFLRCARPKNRLHPNIPNILLVIIIPITIIISIIIIRISIMIILIIIASGVIIIILLIIHPVGFARALQCLADQQD